MWKLSKSLVIILLTILANSAATNVILTQYNDLPSYAQKLIDTKVLVPTNITHGISRFTFSEKLLAAPIFQLHSEFILKNQTPATLGYHNMSKESWIELQERAPEKRICRVGNKLYNLISIQCVAHDSTPTWILSYDTHQGMGFLFLAHSSSFELQAMVDQSKRLSSLLLHDPDYSFSKSIDQSAVESLCSLKKLSQFRICVISADGFHRIKRPKKRRKIPDNDNQVTFVDPNDNFFYDPPTTCPQMRVHYNETKVSLFVAEVQALHCRVSLKTNKYDFYVKLNLCTENRTSVFIIQHKQAYREVRGVIQITQLENIFLMDNLL